MTLPVIEECMQGCSGKAGRNDTTRKTYLEDNIKMDIRGIGWGGMDWIYLAQDRDH
jgi:hypothetical protein